MNNFFRYINKVYADSKIRLFYSTPSCYGEAVKRALTEALPSKTDDFFPYSSDPHAYWTGYFTSRPTFKGLVRQTSNLLQACKQIQATTAGRRSNTLFQFQRSQAIAQHHDAVTGTAKQHVSNNYVLLLDQGVRGCYEILSESYSHLLSLNGSAALKQEYCSMLNVSQCWTTERNEPFIVTLYNPLALPSTHIVRLPVVDGSYTVTDHHGAVLQSQMLPIAEAVLTLPGRNSSATHELVFLAENLPPLGLRSYHIRVLPGKRMFRSRIKTIRLPAGDNVEVSAYGLSLKFDRQTGQLIQVGNQRVHQQLLYYPGMAGNNSRFEFRASGAYIFRPNGTAVPLESANQITTVSGPILTEIRQHINDHAMQIFRLRRGESFVEIDWILGPIPVDDGVGKEYVSRFSALEISNNGTFYTDSNGREILERQVNNQATYKLNVTEPTAGNYYPVNSLAYVENKSTRMRMTVLNDRAQGVSSLLPGSLEFMVGTSTVTVFCSVRGEILMTRLFSLMPQHTIPIGSPASVAWRRIRRRRSSERDGLWRRSGCQRISLACLGKLRSRSQIASSTDGPSAYSYIRSDSVFSGRIPSVLSDGGIHMKTFVNNSASNIS